MNVKDLKRVLKDLPDDAEILISGNSGLCCLCYATRYKVGMCNPFNQHGQTYFVEDTTGMPRDTAETYNIESVLLYKEL